MTNDSEETRGLKMFFLFRSDSYQQCLTYYDVVCDQKRVDVDTIDRYIITQGTSKACTRDNVITYCCTHILGVTTIKSQLANVTRHARKDAPRRPAR